MRVRHCREGIERAVELEARLDGYTVADLVEALEGAGSAGLGIDVDGTWHPSGAHLVALDLREGSRLEVRPVPSPPPSELTAPDSGRVLVVVGGLRAGDRLVTPRTDTWVLGRDRGCDVVIDDPTLSRRHLRVEDGARPILTDFGSRNGTVVSGSDLSGAGVTGVGATGLVLGAPTPVSAGVTVRLGATSVTWRSDIDDVPIAVRVGLGAAGGRIPFNRPPRPRPPAEPAPLAVPAEPPPRPAPEPLSWAGIVLPVVAGAVVAVLWSPIMAVFAALGPVLTVGTWLERRRRATRAHRAAARAVARDVERLARELPAALAGEHRRRSTLAPDPAEIVRRAGGPSVRCWERRRTDPDFMVLGIGTADVDYHPRLETPCGGPAATVVAEMVAAGPPLVGVPLTVTLRAGDVVGVVGPPAVTRSVARSLVIQACVLHGPADLAVAALAPDQAPQWSWLRWLPHSTDIGGGGVGALVATTEASMAGVVEAVGIDDTERVRLVVLEGAAALVGRAAPGRALLAHEWVAAIVIVSDAHELPASCTTVVEITHPAGGLRLVDPRSATASESVTAWGMTGARAAATAARLARLDDPDLGSTSADLPDAVALVDLIGEELTSESVQQRWALTRGTTALAAPVGVDADGVLELDLVADGPHLLIGGMTGSGKSELLRSLVAGLALSADPEHVAFVLVDYKGGAAFDCCADLAHVAGLVTDLDDRLAERALRCLEAELRYREERLRILGAEDLEAFRALTAGADCSEAPLPRLVVVVDEFATLAGELPEFVDALVGVGQRGRSLGVHMVLATQRPAGAVTEDIRANTGCRIALRVADRHDSNDVIGVADAAAIPRTRPGRALARFGPGELVAFQSALVTAVTTPAAGGLRVRVVDEGPTSDEGRPAGESEGESDIARVVRTVEAAHRHRGGVRPRSPWPEPLPAAIAAEELVGAVDPGSPAVWLVDDPDRQRRFVDGWRLDQGHLVVLGRPGSGTTTTLAMVALDLARAHSPDRVHLYGIDLDSGRLAALARLPHCGAVTAPSDGERRVRMLRFLDEEIAARRACPDAAARPHVVLFVDGLAGLARAHDPVRDPEPHQLLSRIYSDGPAVGLRVAVSISRVADLSGDMAASAGVVLIHATTDPSDGLRFGLKATTSDLGSGRAIRVSDRRELQVARFADGDLDAAVEAVAAAAAPAVQASPAAIGSLPPVVSARDLPVRAEESDGRIIIDFAMSDLGLEPVGFTLRDGEHGLILGPPGTGRTATLAAIGAAVGSRAAVVAPERTELCSLLDLEPVPVSALDRLGSGRRVLLVDDGDRLDDPDGDLGRIAADPATRCHIVAVTRAERLRATYSGWLSELRASQAGVLFRPGPIDGDLLGVSLPARLDLPAVAGRGVIASGGAAAVAQVALVAVAGVDR